MTIDTFVFLAHIRKILNDPLLFDKQKKEMILKYIKDKHLIGDNE